MIIFKKVKYKNFLSGGNVFNEINFVDHQMNLLSGKNGSGKTTSLEAIVYALYGKPYRKIVKGLLINTINKKDMLVELTFSIGKNEYLIRRGEKPKIFEIYQNDVLIPQDAASSDYQSVIETQLIKCNFKTFTQIVFLGSKHIPFMELEPKDRRKVIEDILDIGVFSDMALGPLKEDMEEVKAKVADCKSSMNIVETKINMAQQHNDKITKMKNSDLSTYHENLAELQKDIKLLKKEYLQTEEDISNMNSSSLDISSTKEKLKTRQEMKYDIISNKKALTTELKFFAENETCPTCKQAISEDFRTKTCEEHTEKLSNINVGIDKLDSLINKFNDLIAEYDNNEKAYYKQTLKLNNIKDSIETKLKNIASIKKTIADIEERQKESLDFIDVIGYKEELEGYMTLYNEAISEKNALAEISSILKDDGIKSDIVKKYIPKMNELINTYLSNFDLYVNFTLDENFNETIKSRYRDTFSYGSFSEGEKLRINMALMLTWKEIAKKKNSVSTNLLVLDETLDGALDADGVADLIKSLRTIEGNNNIFVISHRGDALKDLFDVNYNFEKIKNFSVMTTIE